MIKEAQLKRYENSKILHFQTPNNLVREIHTSATSLLPIKPEISLFFSAACFQY